MQDGWSTAHLHAIYSSESRTQSTSTPKVTIDAGSIIVRFASDGIESEWASIPAKLYPELYPDDFQSFCSVSKWLF